MTTASHESILCLFATYFFRQQLFFIYEPYSITLTDILGTPHGQLEIFEIVAVYKEILSGL